VNRQRGVNKLPVHTITPDSLKGYLTSRKNILFSNCVQVRKKMTT